MARQSVDVSEIAYSLELRLIKYERVGTREGYKKGKYLSTTLILQKISQIISNYLPTTSHLPAGC